MHRNNIFALIVFPNSPLNDRKLVKQTYGNYLQAGLGIKDELNNIDLSTRDNQKNNAKKVVDYLIKERLISEQCQEVYSEDEEEEIRKRLEDLGYV